MNETEIIKQLKFEGYDSVYIWDAEPNEEDVNHTHRFDTKLVVLSGEIRIGLGNQFRVFKSGDVVVIPRETLHSGLAGAEGCKYIVAAKH